MMRSKSGCLAEIPHFTVFSVSNDNSVLHITAKLIHSETTCDPSLPLHCHKNTTVGIKAGTLSYVGDATTGGDRELTRPWVESCFRPPIPQTKCFEKCFCLHC